MVDWMPIRLGCPVRFRDRWSGRLRTLEVDEGWEVVNVSLQRGILQKATVKLPLTAATSWSDQDIAFDEVTSGKAFAREIPPVAAPTRTLSRDTKVNLPDSRLTGAVIDRVSRVLVQIIVDCRGQEYRVQREDISFQGAALQLGVQVENLAPYLSDEALAEIVRDALANNRDLAWDDRRSLEIQARNGILSVTGNLRTKGARASLHSSLIEALGDYPLQFDVVDDVQLESNIGQALDRAGLPRAAEVYARSTLGRVLLYGYAESAGAIAEAIRAVSRVPGVRAVENRMEVRSAAGQTGLRA